LPVEKDGFESPAKYAFIALLGIISALRTMGVVAIDAKRYVLGAAEFTILMIMFRCLWKPIKREDRLF
jgi:hypothetical protein